MGQAAEQTAGTMAGSQATLADSHPSRWSGACSSQARGECHLSLLVSLNPAHAFVWPLLTLLALLLNATCFLATEGRHRHRARIPA